MTNTVQAEVININPPVQLAETYASDIHILREHNSRTFFNQLKLFHKKEHHGLHIGSRYEFDLEIGGRKTKDNRVFNEIKIKHYKLINE